VDKSNLVGGEIGTYKICHFLLKVIAKQKLSLPKVFVNEIGTFNVNERKNTRRVPFGLRFSFTAFLTIHLAQSINRRHERCKPGLGVRIVYAVESLRRIEDVGPDSPLEARTHWTTVVSDFLSPSANDDPG
jgi:hypothetical protein